MRNDYRGKAVLVTGGTKGIGLATGLAFGRVGAHAYLTHRWGSADEDEVRARFAAAGAPEPTIVEADVSRDEDTAALIARIAERHDRIEAFVSNVCVVAPSRGIASYRRRSLLKSLEYSTWPFVAYVQAIRKALGRAPRYVVGISSDGPDTYFPGYELVAASKKAMEVLCRYLANHLLEEGVRVNVVRTRNVHTDAVAEIFGPDYTAFLRRFGGEACVMRPGEIGDAVLALCSGLLDAMSGQVVQVDHGMAFTDSAMRLYELREQLGLGSDGTLTTEREER